MWVESSCSPYPLQRICSQMLFCNSVTVSLLDSQKGTLTRGQLAHPYSRGGMMLESSYSAVLLASRCFTPASSDIDLCIGSMNSGHRNQGSAGAAATPYLLGELIPSPARKKERGRGRQGRGRREGRERS